MVPATARTVVCLVLVTLAAVPLAAQEEQPSAEQAAMMEAWQKSMTPGSQHSHLAEQAGTWKATLTMWEDPAAPPSVSEGKATRTMILGGRVLEERFEATVMDMPYEGVGHTGYDNLTGKYWGTWVDNMSTGITAMEGTWDAEAGKGTFEGDSPNPMAGGKTPMRIEVRVEEGREINEFYMTGPGGEMIKSMEIVYVRE